MFRFISVSTIISTIGRDFLHWGPNRHSRGWVRMAGRVSLLTGSGFLGARSLIIPSRTGAARQAGGVIRSSGGPVRAPSTCQCGSVGCKRLAVGIGIYCEPVLADFCPDLECLGPGSSMQ